VEVIRNKKSPRFVKKIYVSPIDQNVDKGHAITVVSAKDEDPKVGTDKSVM